jgi:hypothetical protein
VIHGAVIGTTLIILIGLLRRMRFLHQFANLNYRWAAFVSLGVVTLAAELALLQGQTTVFISGTAVPDSPAATLSQMAALLGVEVLVLLTVWFALERLYYVQTAFWQTPVMLKASQAYVMALCVAGVLLLPIVFAGTAMREDRYHYVALLGEDRTVIIQGIHAFTDTDDHFVWDPVNKHLVQISKDEIVTVKHLRGAD